MKRDLGANAPLCLLVASSLLLLLFACRSAPPGTPTMQSLHDAERKGDVMRFAGGAPQRCTWSAPGEELCSWRLSNRQPAWWTIAPTVPTDYQVNLICAFPTDGSPRDPEACNAYPRHYMEFGKLPPVSTRGGARASTGVSSGERAALAKNDRLRAQSRLAEAGTVWEMTSLTGTLPDHCGPVDELNTFCSWRLGHTALGWELLAMLADTKKRVELQCTFPTDGSARGPGTCDAREAR